jgi:hypothetical protein
MGWRERTDLWYGTLLLRPAARSENTEFGGAYVSFVVVASDVESALKHLLTAVRKANWEVTSVGTMKRAWDYHDDEDEDDIIERAPSWLALVEEAERTGLSLGSIHTFRIDKRTH